MKKIILIVFPLVALCCGTVVAQADADKIWDDANTAYINADYVAAIDGYEKLLDSGLESDRLYLNLGNAYFKRGMNGKAILNYNRALKLAPSDDDIRYNLSIANAYVQDKIDAVPVFFARRRPAPSDSATCCAASRCRRPGFTGLWFPSRRSRWRSFMRPSGAASASIPQRRS